MWGCAIIIGDPCGARSMAAFGRSMTKETPTDTSFIWSLRGSARFGSAVWLSVNWAQKISLTFRPFSPHGFQGSKLSRCVPCQLDNVAPSCAAWFYVRTFFVPPAGPWKSPGIFLCIFYAFSKDFLWIFYAFSMHVLCMFYACSMYCLCIFYAFSMHLLCIF